MNLNNYNPKPRGRAPKCYRKACQFDECPECNWFSWCRPKTIKQVVMEFAPLKPEDVP